jgi:hypothetical protein
VSKCASETVKELDECGRYLMSLRRLQSDMSKILMINAGMRRESGVMTRSGSVTIPAFSEDACIESIVERSLLVSQACSGMFWLTVRLDSFQGAEIRATARLIAYNFITSSSLDSFFVGIHILRNSGHNVERVLESFYRFTSIKSVRDRIGGHLSHGGFQPRKELKILEQLYPNNCYWTELNRSWCRSCIPHGGQGRISQTHSSAMSSIQIDCGNVADIPDSLDRPLSGQQLTQEESLSVLKCNICVDSSRPNSPSTHSSRGYLNILGSWVDMMTQRELERVFMESPGGEFTMDLEFAVMHKDWKSVQSLPYMEIYQKEHGRFLNRLLDERDDQQGDYNGNRSLLARVKRLFNGEGLKKHANQHLKWFLLDKDLPQLALLYMRRFGLGTTEDDVESLCQHVGTRVEFIARGRLGYVVQPPQTPMERLAVWATTNESEDLVADIPGIASLLSLSEEESRYRTFPNAFQIDSYRGDVKLCDLLNDFFADLNLASVEEKRVPIGRAKTSLMDSIEYLTSQGRPSLAFSTLKVSTQSLQKAARRVAFYNLFDNGIVASAVALLDLCGESTEKLRVDVQCARTIGNSQLVRDMFLSFDDKGQSQLLNALKLLEESAWAKEPPLETPPVANTGGFESPWHLVALFCRVHKLPRSLTLLHELARNGDWVMFLHESDIQQCPIETVRDVVHLYFETPLRSHLNILLDVDNQANGDHHQTSNETEYLSDTKGDHRTEIDRALSLYKFEKARVHFDLLSADERASVAKEINIPGIEIEIERWFSQPLPGEDVQVDEIRKVADKHPSTNAEVDEGSVREAVNARKFSHLIVTNPKVLDILINVLVETWGLDEWSEMELEAICDIVSLDILEVFGDKLREYKTQSNDMRAFLDKLTYIAYLNSFVNDDKFESFLQSSEYSHLSVVPDVSRTNPETTLDNLYRNTATLLGRDQICLQLLQAAVEIGGRYETLGFYRKHLDVNDLATTLCERFRNRTEVI